MRIISGFLGGRILHTVKTDGLRPAMAKTRESLFSILDSRGIDWPSITALDLFAGCGSLGFECVSRGAKKAAFVEAADQQYKCLLDNAENFAVRDRCEFYREDVRKFLKRKSEIPFNLVFIDPPYGKKMAVPVLTALMENNWLAPCAVVVAELEKQAEVPFVPALGVAEKRMYGQTLMQIWGI